MRFFLGGGMKEERLECEDHVIKRIYNDWSLTSACLGRKATENVQHLVCVCTDLPENVVRGHDKVATRKD